MFDTMTMTKATAALCGSLLVYLLGGWGAELLYHSGGHGKGHGDYHHQAYVIPVERADHGGDEEEEEAIDFNLVLASADAGKGERVWGKCKSCHKLESGANGTGPYLANLIDRDKGAAEGFNYSEALASAEGAWTPDNLQAFLEDPKGYLPGNKMNFRGLAKVEDRANLIAYLQTVGQ